MINNIVSYIKYCFYYETTILSLPNEILEKIISEAGTASIGALALTSTSFTRFFHDDRIFRLIWQKKEGGLKDNYRIALYEYARIMKHPLLHELKSHMGFDKVSEILKSQQIKIIKNSVVIKGWEESRKTPFTMKIILKEELDQTLLAYSPESKLLAGSLITPKGARPVIFFKAFGEYLGRFLQDTYSSGIYQEGKELSIARITLLGSRN
jgi:hypothetical protein